MRIVVITGLSGSGKSTCLRALEDIGFFCVDNMPVILLPRFLKIQSESSQGDHKVALVMDLREKGFLEQYPKIFAKLREKGYRIEILFLEAGAEALLHRFSETRRVHPLSPRANLMEGIRWERDRLAPLRQMADRIVDSTSFNVHQLKDAVQRMFLSDPNRSRLTIHITSFGYRYGLPADADIALDVRFLPNPHFVEALRPLNGHHPQVRDFVMEAQETKTFMERLEGLLTFLIPLYEREGKARLNIALGCTGGHHRSVVMANALGTFCADQGLYVTVHHRDVQKS